MHKNVQKSEWKTCCKISCDYISYSMVKIACGKDAFLEIFQLEASPT